MRLTLGKYNTLRNQILLVFLSVMVLVLSFVGIMTYNLVSTLLKENAENQIQQTAVEATGRIESLYQQIDMITMQISTDSYVQSLLLNESKGKTATFNDRQTLMEISNKYQVFSNGISAFEIFTPTYERLTPLHEVGLLKRVSEGWITEANRAKGQLIWIGQDPKDEGFFLAIRRISLIDRSFSNGGYLIVQIDPNYFDLTETSRNNEHMVLVDSRDRLITSNYEGDISQIILNENKTTTLDGSDYMNIAQTSSITGWTMYFLTPLSTVMKGIPILRSAIILSGAFGFLFFVICSFLFSTMITRPILKLTKTMKRGRDGQLSINPEISSSIEINELNASYNELVENTNHLIQVVYEKEILKSHAELKALQSQINPHFLFNTLDALYWSLEEKGEDELANSVIAMSELFRYTISSHTQDEWVTLKQEIDHIEMYMQLMKMRFGERFTWRVDIPREFVHIKIPKLLIQPIVENAILHGVGNKVGEGFVKIVVEPSEDKEQLRISVQDNGPGMNEETIHKIEHLIETGKVYSMRGNGMAIANVNKRLQLYYNKGQTNQLRIYSNEKIGTCFTFEVPINKGAF